MIMIYHYKGKSMIKDIKAWVNYNPDTGVFTWIKSPSQSKRAGDVVGGSTNNGYLRVGLRGEAMFLHRLAWWWMTGEEPNIIDHINRDRSDNRFSNLREGSRTINNRNLGLSKHNKTGFKGVLPHKSGQFEVNIYFDGSKKHLGTHKTLGKAVKVRLSAEMVRDGQMSYDEFLEEFGIDLDR